MSFRLSFRPEAVAELREARRWYESKRRGLGARFAIAVVDSLEIVQAHPLAFRALHGDIRRALVRGFPFGVFFRAGLEEIVVLAIVHLSRHPRIWQGRE